jgi:Zn-dependent peptidase ImmA (M78 family)/transcriptional regulator with XRE-family HTH domain
MGKAVNHRMITLSRESRGMSQVELARAVGVTQSKISKYESGVLPVTEKDLVVIARTLDYTAEFFYQQDQIYGLGTSFLFHRKRKNVPVSVQKKLEAEVNVMRMKVGRLLRSIEIEHENSFQAIDVDDHGGRADRIAAEVRALWKVPQGPVASVTALIESAGGIVIKMPFETKHIDAAHMWPPGMPPLFFVNQELPGDRLRWTLVHEIGHAIMHTGFTEDIEEQANRFTGEFLMPRDEVRRHLFGLTLERAATLKPYWKVSMAAIILRAKELECISERKYRSLFTSLSAQGYRISEPFPVAVEEPKLLDTIYTAHLVDLGYSPDQLEQVLFKPTPDVQPILHFSGQATTPFYKPSRVAR